MFINLVSFFYSVTHSCQLASSLAAGDRATFSTEITFVRFTQITHPTLYTGWPKKVIDKSGIKASNEIGLFGRL